MDALGRFPGMKRYAARHISLSPSPRIVADAGFDRPTDEALKWLYDAGNALMATLGVTAACVIAHPYRIIPDMKQFVNDNASAAGMSRYQWALSQPNFADYVYFSPHLHLLCYGFLMDSEEFERLTGWVYRNHRARDHQGLRKTLYYILTHAWVRGNSKVVRYWRGMSSRNLGCNKTGYLEEEACPICGAPVVKVYPTHPDEDLRFCEVVVKWIEVREYFIRKKGGGP